MGQIAVIGLGRFGSATAKELVRLGHTVVAVDQDIKNVEKLRDIVDYAVVADASDESALQELNLHTCDEVLVSIGENLKASILCVLHLKNLGIKNIWAKASNRDHHSIISKLGVSRVVHPEEEMGVRIAQAMNYPQVNQYLYLGQRNYVLEIFLPKHLNGKSLDELFNSEGLKLLSCIKKGKNLEKSFDKDTVLRTGDSLVLIGELSTLKEHIPIFEEPSGI